MRWAFSLGLIAVLVALSYRAVCAGMADLYAASPRYAQERWAKRGAPPKLLEAREPLNAMLIAHAWNPRNPNLVEGFGVIYERLASGMPPRSETAVAFYEQALDFFRQAAKQRPTSGYTWSNIALVKAKLGRIDQEYAHALETAVDLSPWEPGVHLVIAEAALPNWSSLSTELRESARQQIGRGMTWQSAEIVKIAQRHKRLAIVCGLKEQSKDVIAACNG